MSNDEPLLTMIRVTGETKSIVEKALEINAKDGVIMPAWLITKSEGRYLFVLGSIPLAESITDVSENEMGRTCWIPEGDVEVLAQIGASS
jgi:hypothetical protein